MRTLEVTVHFTVASCPFMLTTVADFGIFVGVREWYVSHLGVVTLDIEVSYKILQLDVLIKTPSLQNPPYFK